MTTCDIYSQQIPRDQIYNMLNPSSSYFWQQLLPPHQEKKESLYTAPLCVVLQLTLTSVRPLIFKYPQR